MRKLYFLLFFLLVLLFIFPASVTWYMQQQRKTGDKESESSVIQAVEKAALPTFGKESLKAQAVIERTYIVKHFEEGKEPKGNGSSNKKQIDLTLKKKVEEAVRETEGEILVYQGKAILPMYHLVSGGRTEGAVDGQGKPIPYLRSVSSPLEEGFPGYMETKYMEEKTLRELLMKNIPSLSLKSDQELFKEIRILSRGLGGRIKEVQIGSQKLSGEELSKIVGVGSSDIRFYKQDKRIKMVVKGVGSGVGLSQYGAQGMERLGEKYRSILKHYYTGTDIIQVKTFSKK